MFVQAFLALLFAYFGVTSHQYIALQTLPKSKFILSLRNPIDRAWSEYNMERRRIDMQDDFLKALQMRLPDIAECIRKRVPKLPASEALVGFAFLQQHMNSDPCGRGFSLRMFSMYFDMRCALEIQPCQVQLLRQV